MNMDNKKEYRVPEMKEVLLKRQESLLQSSYAGPLGMLDEPSKHDA